MYNRSVITFVAADYKYLKERNELELTKKSFIIGVTYFNFNVYQYYTHPHNCINYQFILFKFFGVKIGDLFNRRIRHYGHSIFTCSL